MSSDKLNFIASQSNSSSTNRRSRDSSNISGGSNTETAAPEGVDQGQAGSRVIQRYREPAVLGEQPSTSRNDERRVVLARQHWVHEIQHDGHQRSLPKRSERGVPNRWRRYAPISYIHTVGGWVNGGVDGHNGRKDDYRQVEPGTQMPPPPSDSVFATAMDKEHAACLPTLTVPTDCRDSAEAAHTIALQLSVHVERMWREFSHQTMAEQSETISEDDLQTTAVASRSGTAQTAMGSVMKVVKEAPRRILDALSSPLRSRSQSNTTTSTPSSSSHTSRHSRRSSQRKQSKRKKRLRNPSSTSTASSSSNDKSTDTDDNSDVSPSASETSPL